MKDKITKLAKGIAELETPIIRIEPEIAEGRIRSGSRDFFDLELTGENGCTIKGVCVSDDIRVAPETAMYAGRRANVRISVDASGLNEGDTVKGSLKLITNAGEIDYPYSFTVTAPAEKLYEEETYIIEDPLNYDEVLDAGETAQSGNDDAPAAGGKKRRLPKDDGELSELVSEMIREKDGSQFAFNAYKEAIARGLSITRLYESYVQAYPDGLEEPMPREVILYFSYDSEASLELCEKIYYNIVRFGDQDPEAAETFASRMSAFAMNQALSGRINRRLAAIYDKMIYPGMIDLKAAEVLPDILKCHEIVITKGSADFIILSYPELKERMGARVIEARVYIPVYFKNAKIDFYKYGDALEEDAAESDNGSDASEAQGNDNRAKCVNDLVRYEERALFDKPELLKKCFEIAPGHRMLKLAACRSILDEGSAKGDGAGILTDSLKDPSFTDEFRSAVIRMLCREKINTSWMRYLREEDYTSEVRAPLFEALMGASDLQGAYALIKKYGTENIDARLLVRLADGLLMEKTDTVEGDGFFLRLCSGLFKNGRTSDRILEYLCHEYTGSAADMLSILKAAGKKELDISDMPERILTFELFTGERADIDSIFKMYISGKGYDDLIVRAYLNVRCEDYFLHEISVDREILFGALYSYLKGSEDPFRFPVIYLIAMTSYFSEKEKLTDEEKELAQKLTDWLIEQGLVFRYTKKLRKLIDIPEEICWKYYIEYRAEEAGTRPKLLIKILPDDTEYHVVEMRRVYRNVYVADVVLFLGDKLHYLIYPSAEAKEAVEEGTINVVKFHNRSNDRMRCINLMLKAIAAGDAGALKENMLNYVENSEIVKELFKLENK